MRRSAERAEPRSKRSDEASARRGEPENGKVFAVVPRMSLVARDWAGARRLAGGQLSLTDAIGLSHSSRMVVGRLRFGDGDTAFVPFGQVGFGQWRADPALMPPGLRDTELASQIGIGFELRLAKNWQLAAETDLTVLYREQRERQNVAGPRMLAAFVGSRAVF